MRISATRTMIWLSNAHRRALALFWVMIGPHATYSILAVLARLLYRLSDPLRVRSEAQSRAALGNKRSPSEVAQIARQAFVHRTWNLADLMLADRLIRRGTCHRYGGRIREPYLSMLLDAQRRRKPVILVTAYYGPFDLLPLFLGYNGIRAGVVYRPHVNPDFDAYRRAIRARSGCELIPDTKAVGRLPQILEQGGTVAIVADHHVTRHGIPAIFLGLRTAASRSVGLLAWRYDATVVVAGIRRRSSEFDVEIVVSDVFDHQDWRDVGNPVVHITERYLRGLEKIILDDPTQYLWGYARWGADLARQLTDEDHSRHISR
ncbi:MAG: lysophospholipid acyltransferase family protein [Phycisphaerae bacterium]|nr:lysophospholipid acyltransferase family protein [Phycisphaerae bacterium]